jgi:hypothetical protein
MELIATNTIGLTFGVGVMGLSSLSLCVGC